MEQLVEYSLEDGTKILVEANALEEEGVVERVAIAPGELVIKASETFERALDVIIPAASAIISKVKRLDNIPDEVEVKFGVKLSSKVGGILTSVSKDPNYEITLKWKNDNTI